MCHAVRECAHLFPEELRRPAGIDRLRRIHPNQAHRPDPLRQRFVMVKYESNASPLNLVLNWIEKLRRLVPTN